MTSFRLLCCILLLTTGLALAQDSLQDMIDSYVAADDPALVVLIDEQGDIETAAQGLADLDAGVPVSADDRFRIGSITKPFLAVVMLQLEEEGVLSLDDPARDWLPAEVVDRIANLDSATLRQLLNHTSGIFDYLESDDFWNAVYSDPTYEWTAPEVLTYAYDFEPYFAPGEGFTYSNSNYILLQLVIERATGDTLAAALRSRILKPLGMDDTYLEIVEDLPGGFIHSYDDWDGDGALDDVTFNNEGNGLGDGGIVTTAADLATFMRGVVDGRLLSDDSLDAMLETVDDGEGDGYGLGMSVYDYDTGEVWGHDGYTAGFISSMVYLPDEDVVIVALSNSPDMQDALDGVVDELIG